MLSVGVQKKTFGAVHYFTKIFSPLTRQEIPELLEITVKYLLFMDQPNIKNYGRQKFLLWLECFLKRSYTLQIKPMLDVEQHCIKETILDNFALYIAPVQAVLDRYLIPDLCHIFKIDETDISFTFIAWRSLQRCVSTKFQ